ncbi:iron-hydroxamate ABC transporter substrate-binding protein [Domibacillus robiginosus]|uniref:iron-hydroxamate ABC transporter substrate-binding protein n=1 Tax=Domibacillus robiginosus TaxID=1071054 RepID=UPI00067B41CC|nr:iron-hydroxamate ABC transporter substrate-binding protein [Domibacillus robiginosus]
MSIFTRKTKAMSVCLLASSIALAACGSTQEQGAENNGAAESTQEASEKTEHTLTDAMGNEVTIPANPERVLASYLEDPLTALGITPVAQWSVSDGTSVQDYLQDSLQDVPTIPHDLPYEAVASVKPDLIIMDSPSMVEGGKYEQYAKIAPTYVIGEELNNDWREELLTVGEIFNEEEKAQSVLDEYDQKAKEAKEQIANAIPGESAAAVWLINKQFFMVSENLSSGDVLYNDLGIAVPKVVSEISKTDDANWLSISMEKLAELDADHLFLINSDGESANELLQDPLLQNIPAVKNGNVYEFGAKESWLYTGAVANSQIIDRVLESVAKQK